MVAATPPGVEACRLEHGAYAPRRIAQPCVRRIENQRASRRWGRQAKDQLEGCGLPGTVRPEESGDRTATHREGQVIDGGDLAEPLGESLDVYCALHAVTIATPREFGISPRDALHLCRTA